MTSNQPRPKSVVTFERLSIASLILGIPMTALTYDLYVSATVRPAMIFTIQGITILVMIALILWASRRRSNIARWIWSLMFVVGVLFYIPSLIQFYKLGIPGVISTIQVALQAAGVYFLMFPAASREWFRRDVPKLMPGAS